LPTWYQPAEICRLATPLVVARAGEPTPDFEVLLEVCSPERMAEIRALQVTMPETPIASSTIRRMIASGEDASGMVPMAVLDYVLKAGLYR
jgi:nicotinate-nucleotide adenylyltransferase